MFTLNQLDAGLKVWLPQFLELFTHLSYGFTAFLVLLALAAASIVTLLMRARHVAKDIDEAIETLSSTEDESEFTKEFHNIDAKLSGNTTLGRVWDEFLETLIPPLDSVDDPSYRVYRNTKRPQSFFTSRAVLSSIRPWMDGERLVGIGLILTFLGLVAALTKAGDAFTSADSNTIKDALAALLETAGAKFLASIGGLSGSIIQSMSQNFIIHRSQNRLNMFNDMLEQRLSYASLERIAADHYGHAQRQTARLEDMGTEITMALADRIESALTQMPEMMGQEFSKAIDPMTSSLESVTDRLTNDNTNALSKMVTEFSNEVRGAGQDSMNLVVQQLDALSSTMTNTVGSLAESNTQVKVGLEHVLDALGRTAEKFEQSFESGASSASNQIQDASSSISETMRELLEQTRSQQTDNQRAIESLTDKFQLASDEMASSMKKQSEQASIAVASQLQDASSSVSHTMLELLEATRKQQSESQETIESFTSRFQEASANMSANMERQAQEASEQVAGALSSSLEEILSSAKAASAQLSESVNSSISTANENLNSQMDSLAKGINSKMETAVTGIERALQGWEQQTQALNVAMEKVNGELVRHEKGLSVSSTKLNEAGSAFSSAANDVLTATQPLSQIAAQSNQAIDALKAASEGSMAQLTRVNDSVDASLRESRDGIRGLHETWRSQAAQLQGADKELEQAFKHITANLAHSLSTLEQFSTGLSAKVGSMMEQLSSIVQELSDTVEQLTPR